MGHLGDFSVERPEETNTFGYFGATVRVHPHLGELAILEAFRTIETFDVEKGTNTDAREAIRSVFGAFIHPDDLDVCWRAACDNGQGIEDVAALARRLVEAVTDRPTQLPSDSSDGQSNTDESSGGISSTPAMRLVEARPDLQLMVLQAEEERAAASA